MADIARQVGVSSSSVYGLTRAHQRGFASDYKYQEYLAQQNGFASRYEYVEHLSQQRSKRKRNRQLRGLVRKRLREIGKNQSWLAEELGVSRQAVSLYVQGKSIPRGKTLGRLLDIICSDDATRRSLDDTVE